MSLANTYACFQSLNEVKKLMENIFCPCGELCPTLCNYGNLFNTLRPRQNGRHFADDTFNRTFVNENVRISIKFSLKFVPKVPINDITSLVQIMAWCRRGDKPLYEPTLLSLLTHIWDTRPQWVLKRQVLKWWSYKQVTSIFLISILACCYIVCKILSSIGIILLIYIDLFMF